MKPTRRGILGLLAGVISAPSVAASALTAASPTGRKITTPAFRVCWPHISAPRTGGRSYNTVVNINYVEIEKRALARITDEARKMLIEYESPLRYKRRDLRMLTVGYGATNAED